MCSAAIYKPIHNLNSKIFERAFCIIFVFCFYLTIWIDKQTLTKPQHNMFQRSLSRQVYYKITENVSINPLNLEKCGKRCYKSIKFCETNFRILTIRCYQINFRIRNHQRFSSLCLTSSSYNGCKLFDNLYRLRSISINKVVSFSDSTKNVPPDDVTNKAAIKLNASHQDDHPVEDLVNAPVVREKTLEINTNKGKLVVTTSSDGKELKNVVLEVKPDKKEVDSVKSEDVEDPAKKVRRRARVDFNRSSLERNFIIPTRAMSDFLLKPSDLENLPKTKRRSPYEQEPPITVYWRKDVEEKAIEVWGSRENLLRECLKREIEKKMHQQNIFTVKRRLRDYRREIGSKTGTTSNEEGLTGQSGKVVLIAIAINATNFVFKICAWLYTGSHSMFAESIHSLADTINQLILAYGIHKSVQIADPDHPYGYTNMKYVSSLISGVGIFCIGTGLSFYHGIIGLANPAPIEDFYWAFCILGGSLISEGATLMVAVNTIRQAAKQNNQTFKEYVMRGEDPCVNVVLFEDTAAVLSVVLAAGCMGLSTYTGSSIPDAAGSLIVGGILGSVASFIIYSNANALVGRSIAAEQLDKINSELESDVMIRAIHDVKGIDMGNSLVRYKAEMDFDGRELTRFYLEKQDLNNLLEEIKQFSTIDELEAYMLKHGEGIVDLMGGEIDRIEMKIRKKFPEIRHCDLEIL